MLKEAHPEIAFHFLNGGKSMKFNKKTQQGLQERLDVLECYNKGAKLFFQESTSKFLRKDVAKDDIIDAMCLAICGSNLPNRIIATLPQKKELDSCGLQMAVHYSIERNEA